MTRLQAPIRLFLLFCGLASVAFAGCTSNDNGTIDYQLSGGLAGVHASLHITPDGKLTRTKLDGSTETSQLDATALADLQNKVDEAQFATLETSYGCGCSDDFHHTITVHVDGMQYTVKTDSSATYPDRLKPLIDALKTMVQEPPP